MYTAEQKYSTAYPGTLKGSPRFYLLPSREGSIGITINSIFSAGEMK